MDLCPDDPLKSTPGDCGCGEPDTDSDGDGVGDCIDACPGEDDLLDTDGDGAPDCTESCPLNPFKLVPGDCGCDLEDVDADSAGGADCLTCAPHWGDVHPTGVGDEAVDLRDYVVARRKTELETVAVTTRDLTCGNVAASELSCEQGLNAGADCPREPGGFDSADTVGIRGLVSGLRQVLCRACLETAPTAEELRLPGDVAPSTAADGELTVADVLLLLRWAVFLDPWPEAGSELRLRADVAPVVMDGGLAIVGGDGSIDVSDVIVVLRAVVQLHQLVWPERSLSLDWEDTAELIAFTARLEGWPRWATAISASGPCSGDPTAGLDLAGEGLAYTCASDPTVVMGPTTLLELGYRAPVALAPGDLALTATAVTSGLAVFEPTLTLSDPAP